MVIRCKNNGHASTFFHFFHAFSLCLDVAGLSVDTIGSNIVVGVVYISINAVADIPFFFDIGSLVVIFFDIATAVLSDTADRLEAS